MPLGLRIFFNVSVLQPRNGRSGSTGTRSIVTFPGNLATCLCALRVLLHVLLRVLLRVLPVSSWRLYSLEKGFAQIGNS